MRSSAGWIAYTAAVAACGVAARLRWDSAEIIPSMPRLSIPAVSPGVDSAPVWLEDADDVVVAGDPFRVARAPAATAFNPTADGPAAPAMVPGAAGPAPARPTLILKAIVGGPPWQAIIDGIPGQTSGTVVRAGATFDRLSVRSVTRDSVVVQGPDTSWVLAFRRRP